MAELLIREAREEYTRWLLVTRDLSPHTVRAYVGDIAALERHLGDRALVGEIDRTRLLGFIEAQREAGISARSLRRRAAGLRGFCAWLRARLILPADPFAGTTVAASKGRQLPRAVNPHDIRCLIASLEKDAGLRGVREPASPLDLPHRATTLLAVALLLSTGLRVHEVVGVRCDDIDLEGRTIRVLGKGRRERQVYLTNDWICALTHAYLGTRASLSRDHEQLLFNRRGMPLTPAAMRGRLLTAVRDANVAAHITPHMLRHTAATNLIEAGVDIRFIQRLLGHASLSTTEIYTHVSDGALRRVVTDADILGRSLHLDN